VLASPAVPPSCIIKIELELHETYGFPCVVDGVTGEQRSLTYIQLQFIPTTHVMYRIFAVAQAGGAVPGRDS
jgi:hypothetical protein